MKLVVRVKLLPTPEQAAALASTLRLQHGSVRGGGCGPKVRCLPQLRPADAVPADDARTVSIWTVHGRLKGVAYTGSPEQVKAVATLPVGESDVVHRDGMWFLYATVEAPERDLADPDGFLGVDMGIANIAYDSDGTRYAGTRLNGYRRRQARLRRRLSVVRGRCSRRSQCGS